MSEDHIKLHPGERIDDLGLGGLKIIQNPQHFCFGMDAVLLSSFAKAYAKEDVLDLCTGNGIIPILLSAKTTARHITGLELLAENVALAERSVALNGLSERISLVEADVKDASALLGAGRFDVITCNPPYMKEGQGLVNDRDVVTLAKHEVEISLSDITSQAAKLLKPKGRVYFVHRPYRLAELLVAMHEAGIEPKRLRMVQPFADKKPNLVLVEGAKGAKAFLEVEAALVVYEDVGKYTDEVLGMYGMNDGGF